MNNVFGNYQEPIRMSLRRRDRHLYDPASNGMTNQSLKFIVVNESYNVDSDHSQQQDTCQIPREEIFEPL